MRAGEKTEKLFPMVDAVEMKTGRRPHLSTCLRWAMRGSRGIRLETCVLGGRRLTSLEAVQRYIDATTAARETRPRMAEAPTPRQQTAAAERAAKELASRLS